MASRTLSMSSLWLTQELGYFQAAGLETRVEQSPSPAHSISLLSSGEADAVFTSFLVPFLSAAVKGLPLRIVAGREIASTTCGHVGAIYGLRKRFPSGLDDPAVLKGRRVAAGPSIGMSQFSLETYLATAKLGVEDVHLVLLRSAEAVTAMISGSIDALVLHFDYDRNLARVLADTVHTSGVARYYPNLQYSYIYYGKKLLEADPGVGARFLAAYLRGAREFARGVTPQYMKEFASANAADPDGLITACRDTFSLTGDVDLKSLGIFVDWAARRKYVPGPVDPAGLVDTRFLARAHAI
jgi:NitT/TauT family transport system substrate-binding protein